MIEFATTVRYPALDSLIPAIIAQIVDAALTCLG